MVGHLMDEEGFAKVAEETKGGNSREKLLCLGAASGNCPMSKDIAILHDAVTEQLKELNQTLKETSNRVFNTAYVPFRTHLLTIISVIGAVLGVDIIRHFLHF